MESWLGYLLLFCPWKTIGSQESNVPSSTFLPFWKYQGSFNCWWSKMKYLYVHLSLFARCLARQWWSPMAPKKLLTTWRMRTQSATCTTPSTPDRFPTDCFKTYWKKPNISFIYSRVIHQDFLRGILITLTIEEYNQNNYIKF